jgi:hypothetical protein
LSKPHRRHIRNYLIDKSLQLRYVAAVAIVSAVIAGGLGYLVNHQAAVASDVIIKSMRSSGFLPPEAISEITDSLHAQDRKLLVSMLIMGIGLMVVLSGYLVLMTHKVAGPLYKIGLYFDQISGGKLPKVWPLRKGDQLVDFFEQFRTMDEALRVRTQDEILALEKFVALAEKAGLPTAGELGHRVDEVRALIKEKQASLT